MGWAIVHFQFGVVTLQWCHDRRGHGVFGKRSCAHDQGSTRVRACLGRPIAIGLLGCSIATEILASQQDLVVRCRDTVLVSRQGQAYGRCRDKRAQQSTQRER